MIINMASGGGSGEEEAKYITVAESFFTDLYGNYPVYCWSFPYATLICSIPGSYSAGSKYETHYAPRVKDSYKTLANWSNLGLDYDYAKLSGNFNSSISLGHGNIELWQGTGYFADCPETGLRVGFLGSNNMSSPYHFRAAPKNNLDWLDTGSSSTSYYVNKVHTPTHMDGITFEHDGNVKLYGYLMSNGATKTACEIVVDSNYDVVSHYNFPQTAIFGEVANKNTYYTESSVRFYIRYAEFL